MTHPRLVSGLVVGGFAAAVIADLVAVTILVLASRDTTFRLLRQMRVVINYAHLLGTLTR